MRFYYSIYRSALTNGTAGTESTTGHIRVVSGSARTVAVTGIYAAARATTTGGLVLRMKQWTTTASSGGSAFTPVKRYPNNPAASLVAATDASAITAGTGGPNITLALGCPAGGGAGWVPTDPADAIQMEAGGGANNNLDIYSIASAASMAVDITVEVAE